MSFLKNAINQLLSEDTGRFERAGARPDSNVLSGSDLDDQILDNKGHFGGRSISFKQDVYRIPEKPSGDHTQPVGLITQSDLHNYVIFRKNDRITFKYESGTSGNCDYQYKKNGSDSFIDDIAFSDAVIQELIDDGACELV